MPTTTCGREDKCAKMWLFSRFGFYSIVYKQGKTLIRARVREHLQNLIGFAVEHRLAGAARWEIAEWDRADYRWRIIMSKAASVRLVTLLADDVEHDNFKGACWSQVSAGKLDRPYERALHEVWEVMGRLQAGGPYGRREVEDVGMPRRWREFDGSWPTRSPALQGPAEQQFLQEYQQTTMPERAPDVGKRERKRMARDLAGLIDEPGADITTRGSNIVFTTRQQGKRGQVGP